MSTSRPLRNPPITEALIDFRIASDPAIDATRLSTLRELLVDAYPKVEERRHFKAEVRVEEGKVAPPAVQDLGFLGLFFTRGDGATIAQFRRDGFTLNQLKPYPGWDAFAQEGARLWHIYNRIAKPVSITRLAVRYINSLVLPYQPGDDFERFLTAPAEMPEGAPQAVSSFLTRVVAHHGDDVVVVTQKLDSADEETSLTLDIDAFCPAELSADAAPIDQVLLRLRALKNEVFFASLTDEALELFG
jgi:uncharacterized protein (TIGR04255 family)